MQRRLAGSDKWEEVEEFLDENDCKEKFWSDAGELVLNIFSSVESCLEKKNDEVIKLYEKKLGQTSDSVVLKKLDEVNGELYEITLREAKRRGLR